MTREVRRKLIEEIEKDERLASLEEEVRSLNEKIDLLLDVIVVRQKDACEVADITAATVRNKVKRGEVNVLQADGSRANYLTLQTTRKLKERRARR